MIALPSRQRGSRLRPGSAAITPAASLVRFKYLPPGLVEFVVVPVFVHFLEFLAVSHTFGLLWFGVTTRLLVSPLKGANWWLPDFLHPVEPRPAASRTGLVPDRDSPSLPIGDGDAGRGRGLGHSEGDGDGVSGRGSPGKS